MNTIVRMPKAQIAGLLVLLFASSAPFIGILEASYLLLLCLGFTVFLDMAWGYVGRKIVSVPYAAIVTGLILTLLIDPGAQWYQILVICVAAVGIKNLTRGMTGRVLFNPAGFGILAGWIFFGLNPSWWGIAIYGGSNGVANIIMYFLIAGIGFVSCIRLKKYYAVLAYILAYSVLSFFVLSSSVASVLQTVISPGVLFFAFLMLPEPMTSPVRKNRQILYGLFIAALSVLFVFMASRFSVENLPDFSILALLIGNILFFRYR